MLNARVVVRAIGIVALGWLFAGLLVTGAQAQNFTLTPSALTPPAGVDPGGTATATIALTTTTGFSSSVAFTCSVTSNQVTTDPPMCLISPSSDVPNATLSLTLTTVGATPAGQYTIAVAGTSGAETETTQLFLQVVDVPQDYTLTVSKAISPTTVTAGNTAQATITVTPIAGYTGSVTLSCLSITPTVAAAPVCTFNPATVAVTNGAAPPSVLTISTYGTTTGRLSAPHIFEVMWLAVPALALMGAGARGGRKKNVPGLFLLMLVCGALLLLPACSSSSTTTTTSTSGLVTPKNTYTFTLTGVDQNGVSPSNTTSGTGGATVSLTVN